MRCCGTASRSEIFFLIGIIIFLIADIFMSVLFSERFYCERISPQDCECVEMRCYNPYNSSDFYISDKEYCGLGYERKCGEWER